MRTYESEPELLKPLGEKVVTPSPITPTQPNEGSNIQQQIIVGHDGKLRTNIPLPKSKSCS